MKTHLPTVRRILRTLAICCVIPGFATAQDRDALDPPSPSSANSQFRALEEGDTQPADDSTSGYLSEADAYRPMSEDCPSVEQIRQQFKPVSQIKLALQPNADERPTDCAQNVFHGRQAPIAHNASSIAFHWEPTNFAHQPLYFDDVPLERYGQSVCPAIQPWISGARFVLTFPVIPYKMGYQHTHDCVSVLGYHRPGNCAPCKREVLPWDGEAALWQAASTVGLVFLLP